MSLREGHILERLKARQRSLDLAANEELSGS